MALYTIIIHMYCTYLGFWLRGLFLGGTMGGTNTTVELVGLRDNRAGSIELERIETIELVR